jgi:hypothetical protein
MVVETSVKGCSRQRIHLLTTYYYQFACSLSQVYLRLLGKPSVEPDATI